TLATRYREQTAFIDEVYALFEQMGIETGGRGPVDSSMKKTEAPKAETEESQEIESVSSEGEEDVNETGEEEKSSLPPSSQEQVEETEDMRESEQQESDAQDPSSNWQTLKAKELVTQFY